MEHDIKEILFTEEQIKQRTAEMAQEITEKYRGKDLLLVGVLNGGFIFLSDLARSIPLPMDLEFVQASSYGNGTVSTELKILKDISCSLVGRNVIIVEDIIDSGRTLSLLAKDFEERGAKSVEICSLLTKPDRHVVPVKGDYIGFTIPNEFVVGYGLDYSGKYRNLPYVGVLKRCIYEEAANS